MMLDVLVPVCAICGTPITADRLTCSDDCHEKAVDFIESQYGYYKKVVDAVSGITYRVPVRDIIELGLKHSDLVNYPAWDEE